MKLLAQKSFVADKNGLAIFLAWVEPEFQKILPQKIFLRALLAVEEAAANIVSYAYPSGWEKNPVFTASLEVKNKYLVLALMDEGVPFDPLQAINADAGVALEQRNLGGWGRVFLEKFTDKREYDYKDGKNQLRLYFICEDV